jgi:malonyl-CoA O-methyltransferase
MTTHDSPSQQPRTAPPFELDRRAVVRSFSRAAAHYEEVAQLQRRVRQELLDRLQYFTLDPKRVVDLGAGTGLAAQQLHRRYPHAQLLAIDIAEGMLQATARARWPWQRAASARICADARALPLPSQSVDLIYSNLMLQWCDQPGTVFAELARVLKPTGLLLFSTFGPDTLGELRSAWSAADDHSHVSLFADLQQLGDGLMRAGLAEPVMDLEHYRLHYPDAHALMRELKQLGARNATRARARGLTGRARMQAMIDAYEGERTPQGLPATYEVIFGAAFGSDTAARAANQHGAAGEVAVPLSALKAKRR